MRDPADIKSRNVLSDMDNKRSNGLRFVVKDSQIWAPHRNFRPVRYRPSQKLFVISIRQVLPVC